MKVEDATFYDELYTILIINRRVKNYYDTQNKEIEHVRLGQPVG